MSGFIRRGPNKSTPWTADGWPKRVRDFKGLRAKTRRDLKSGWMQIPAGSMVTIGQSNRARAIRFERDPCETCGVRVYMTGLHWRDLELVK